MQHVFHHYESMGLEILALHTRCLKCFVVYNMAHDILTMTNFSLAHKMSHGSWHIDEDEILALHTRCHKGSLLITWLMAY
jgi:hypothetical protein